MAATPERGHHPRFTIHDRLRKAREAANLEQAELAEMIEVDRGSVSNYETGKTQRLKSPVLKRWAMACEVDYEWLVSGLEVGPGTPPGKDVIPRACYGATRSPFLTREHAPNVRVGNTLPLRRRSA